MTLPYEIVSGLLIAQACCFILLVILPKNMRNVVVKFLSTSQFVARFKFLGQIFFVLVVILFLESLRAMKSAYSSAKVKELESQIYAKRFYAERNLYLTGFTLFLAFVLNRYLALLSAIFRNEEELRVIKSQAGNQSSEYLRLLSALETAETKLRKFGEKEDEIEKKGKNILASEKQVEGLQKEYMRLTDEYAKLEKKLHQSENDKDK